MGEHSEERLLGSVPEHCTFLEKCARGENAHVDVKMKKAQSKIDFISVISIEKAPTERLATRCNMITCVTLVWKMDLFSCYSLNTPRLFDRVVGGQQDVVALDHIPPFLVNGGTCSSVHLSG